jgi:hypothetical protein
MRKRKLRWLLALAGVAVLVAGALLLWPSHSMREKFERVQEGMCRAEVEAILGPPGDYRTGPTAPPPEDLPRRSPLEGQTSPSGDPVVEAATESPADFVVVVPQASVTSFFLDPMWDGDDGLISVSFRDERVLSKQFAPRRRVPQTPLENLQWRAKRQWRKWFPG